MKSLDTLGKKTYIFGYLFLLSNKLQAVIDRDFSKYDLTAKQWFLMIILEEFFKTPPTLKEVSDFMGSSHQNVKQIVTKLVNKEFMTIEKDKDDKRALRLSLTDKCDQFWGGRKEIDLEFFENLFSSFTEEEIDLFYSFINKLYDKVKSL
ncbi:MarR family transcriptional regulator [Mycoplasmatota bacterium]|nr:MarR family transcriptional regulator [Mycoplasmatota bacterium]